MNTQNLNSAIYTILDNFGVKEIKGVTIKENTIEFKDQLSRVISMPMVINNEVCNYITKDDLFTQQAPSFNFELDSNQLLEQALKSGYVTKVDGVIDRYKTEKKMCYKCIDKIYYEDSKRQSKERIKSVMSKVDELINMLTVKEREV